ncbi:MAG TPA: glycerol kinase GlpK [Saprospiraceae bacterium]|nr:glycerol kinase GlpK [Saprospiraceae bacterium]
MKEKKFIIAIDQGTTSSRAIVFDQSGSIVGIAQKEFEQIYPQPGWVEHRPGDILETQIEVLRKVVSDNQIDPETIAALGITNQRETTLVWDKSSGKAVHNAIVWQDRRTAAYCEEIRKKHKGKIHRKTGLIVDAYFSASKIRWILDYLAVNMPAVDINELAFGTVDSWLVYHLTGKKVHATDATNASRTMLFNINELKWDDELLSMFNVPQTMLPEVKSCNAYFGNLHPDILGASIPIHGIAGDQQAALFGQMCIEPGMMKNTYGTGCFLVLNTGSDLILSENNLLSTLAWQWDGKPTYALEGSVFIGGAVIQWLRDGLQIIKDASQSERLAMSVTDNGGVVFVPALTGLGAPYWDPYARGAIFGITRGTTKAHITRAALESIAFQVRDITEAMASDMGRNPVELRVDGGAIENNFLLQAQADISALKVVRPAISETTALGAAYFAGLGCGFWSGIDEVRSQWKVEKEFLPQLEDSIKDRLVAQWKKAIERSFKWAE